MASNAYERRHPWLGLTQSEARLLAGHIVRAIIEMQSNGTTGCSYENLRQLTRTTGLACTRAAYLAAFGTIADLAANQLGFELFDGNLN